MKQKLLEKLKCLLAFQLLWLVTTQVLAQGVQVRGKVSDQAGQALPGVTVLYKGSNLGVTTDTDGNFSISLPSASGTLVVSFIGYQTQEVPVNNRTSIQVQLAEDAKALSEVVVVGYGTQKKESLTGAISNITSKDIQTTTHSSLAQKLQGKVPGLNIRQNAGEPGEFNSMINIRGFGTPLFVIDGIARDGAGEFQRLNPEDIESISVLKDASAAIYGLRAANGVIIVTTKKGAKGKPSFSYNAVGGVMRPTNVPRMASAAEWMQIRNDAAIFGTGSPFITKEELQKYIDGAPGYQGTDWYDLTMKKVASQYQHNISATGGTDKTQYFVSFGYLNEDGLLKSNDMGYDRYTFRSNLTTELANNLNAQVLIGGRYDQKEVPGENFFNIFKGTRVTLPTETPYANNNPAYPGVVSSGQNPLVLSERDLTGYNEDVTRNIQTSVALTYQVPFVQGLSLRGMAAYDMNNYQNKNLFKSYKLYTYSSDQDRYVAQGQRSGSAAISNYNSNNNRVTLQGQLLYDTQLAEKHNIKTVLVVEQQQFWDRWSSLKRYYGGFYTNDQINQAGLANQETNGLENETASLSYIGRFNYDYADKYLLEFAFRQDGSYRYHPDRRWGFFPVVSAGWRISEEGFLKNKVGLISNLKLRASYGLVGEDAGSPFQYVPGFSTTGGGGYEFINGTYTTGAASPAIVNERLTWFTSKVTDLGLDLGLWNDRLNIEADVYQRDREGLLALRNVSLPNTFGGTLPQENLNSDRVQGFEFAVGHRNRINDFNYNVGLNFNYARTMNRYVERGPFVSSYDRWRNGAGNRYNDIVWGYTYDGQFQNEEEIINAPIQNGDLGNTRELPGDFKYKDLNNDGVINGLDETPLFYGGSPKIHYGFTLGANWKGFDTNILLQGSGRYSVRFREVYAEVMAFRGNTPAYFFDRWHKADPYNPDSEWVPGKWPASRFIQNTGSMYAESSVWRKDASYLRLKSVELGYTLNNPLLKSVGIDRIRLYANAHNLFTLADPFVKPFDPEKIEGAFSAGFTYPLTQSYNFGFNLSF